jgi:hypothetical protein
MLESERTSSFYYNTDEPSPNSSKISNGLKNPTDYPLGFSIRWKNCTLEKPKAMTMKNNLYPKLSQHEKQFNRLLFVIFSYTIVLSSQFSIAQSDHGNSNGAIPSAR